MAYLPLLPQRPIHVHEIYTVHYFEYAGSYAFSGESHDFWELLYVDRGTLRVTAGDQVWELSRGQMIFHAPGEFHALSATGVAPDLVVVSFGCNSPDMNFFQGLITTAGEAERALLARIVEESTAAFSTPLDDPSTQSLQRREISPFAGAVGMRRSGRAAHPSHPPPGTARAPAAPHLEAMRASSGWPPT